MGHRPNCYCLAFVATLMGSGLFALFGLAELTHLSLASAVISVAGIVGITVLAVYPAITEWNKKHRDAAIAKEQEALLKQQRRRGSV